MHIISLFSGAGGLDLGFEQEGFRPIVAYDIDPAAVATYNYNREGAVAREADLLVLSGDDIVRDVAALELDEAPRGVVGGPPCQYFSNGNRTPRQEDDPRRLLPVKYAEILKRLNTEYTLDFFIFENVTGLTFPRHAADFKSLLKMFEGAGFRVVYDVLNAYDYGLPQFRKRVFIVGWNLDLYPDAQEYEFPPGNPSGLTVEDRIRGLQEPRFWTPDLDPETFPEHPNHWTMNPVSDKFRNPPPAGLRKSTRSFRRLVWGEPSYTVAYGHNEIHVHPGGHRRLSIYEAMLLQGFPRARDAYRLIGNLTQQVTLVSDAVPPSLSAYLARSIRQFIEAHPYDERARQT